MKSDVKIEVGKDGYLVSLEAAKKWSKMNTSPQIELPFSITALAVKIFYSHSNYKGAQNGLHNSKQYGTGNEEV